jgi:aryl-alcohol dehydrogenase-like predicted oxidoreductase
LINRAFEIALHEMCYREQISLLAYSPLAFGLLSGKYLDSAASGRMTLFPAFGQRYQKPNVQKAVAEYAQLARAHGLSPAVMALAFVRSRSFVASTIIGATTMAQLQENLKMVELNEEVLKAIEALHLKYFNPAP